MTLKAKCGIQPNTDPVAQTLEAGDSKFGMEVAPLTPAVAKQLGVDGTKGLVVTSVAPGGKAANMGLSRGDVIVEVNRKAVSTIDDFHNALSGSEEGELLLVRSSRGSRFIVVG